MDPYVPYKVVNLWTQLVYLCGDSTIVFHYHTVISGCRCSACDAALSSWYFEKDGLLFCKDDYWTKYGESCQDCGQVGKNECWHKM